MRKGSGKDKARIQDFTHIYPFVKKTWTRRYPMSPRKAVEARLQEFTARFANLFPR